MDASTEIRKLRPAELYTLARILTASESWKNLMAVVPKEGTENVPKFNTEHFALIEQASCQQRKSAAEIFLEEWSTMGKKRPTLQSTLNLLVKAQLFRAADYIAVDLLQGEPPRRPMCGPAAQVEITDEEIAKLMNNTISEYPMPTCPISNSNSLGSVLDEIGYPSQLSADDSKDPRKPKTQQENLNDFEESTAEMLNLRLNTTENFPNNSNLIQLSTCKSVHSEKYVHQTPLVQCVNSNLIKFSTEIIEAETATADSLSDYPEVVLQRWNNAETSSSNNADVSSSRGENSSNTSSEINESSSTEPESESTSVGSNWNNVELQSSELPAFVAEIGRGSTVSYDELKSSELPQFIADICNRD